MLRKLLVASASAVLALGAASAASAHVATIDGGYDDAYYDTPDLVIHNSSGFAFTNVKLTLHGYQGLNNGITQSRNLADIAAGTDFTYIWLEPTTPGNLFSYDYDDEYGVAPILVGNFDVTFTAMWNGVAIFSQFSPHTNATGAFVGWEGLDPNGLAETAYDAHVGTVGGTLAYIDIGKPGVPEPGVWALMLAGFGLAGSALRRRRAALA